MAKMGTGRQTISHRILLAANRPILRAPAMNPLMWKIRTRRNVAGSSGATALPPSTRIAEMGTNSARRTDGGADGNRGWPPNISCVRRRRVARRQAGC